MRGISGVVRVSAIAGRSRAMHNKKAAHAPPFMFALFSSSQLRRFSGRLFLLRTRVEPLGIDIAVDEFDHRYRRVIAVAKAGLDDAGVAALAVIEFVDRDVDAKG